MTTPKKINFLSKVGKVLGLVLQNPLVRGTIKSLPGGNFVYELAENIRHAKKGGKEQSSAPHSAVSLLAQLVFLGIIIYAFATKQISIDDVMRYIAPDDFKIFGSDPDSVVSPLDSIPA
jgi:hypothetical protein